jgi:hypothetical protein
MLEIRERPPPILKTLISGPWEVMLEIWERPPLMLKMSMAGPLEGDVSDPGVPTTYVEDVEGGPPGRSGLHPWSKGVL